MCSVKDNAAVELVPAIPWHELATKRDIHHQDELWRAEFARLETRTEAMINDAVNRLTFRLLPAMATMIAIFGAIAAAT